MKKSVQIRNLSVFLYRINHVIFSRLTEIDKENCRGFDELIDKYTKSTEENIGFLINDLTNVNRKIIDKETKLLSTYKIRQEALLKDAKTQLEAHMSIKPKKIDKPELPKEKQEMYDSVLEKIKELSNQSENENQKLFSLNEKARKLQDILEEVDEIHNRFAKSMEHINEELFEFDLSVNSIFDLKVNKEKVNAKKTEIDQLITEVKDKLENPESGLEIQLIKYTKEKNDIVAEEDKHIQEYNEYLNNLKEWSDIEKTCREAVKVVEDEIKYISGGIQGDLKSLYFKRDEIARDILEEKKKIIQIYNRFKKPVDDFLSKNGDLLSDYSICIRSGLTIDTTFEKNLFDYINRQKRNVFKEDNYQLYKTIEELGDIECIEEYLNIPNKIIEKMSEFPDGIIPQIKESRMLDFYNYLFGLGYLTNKYELVSDGKTLDKLSPGERGALLLIFYLLLDLRDIPLVIDQPEDNLDNQSVTKVLVPFIQTAKNRRQIILVTHNPNLAVVADSDQIIHVKIDKENDQLVEVEAGGIENDVINQAIVTILEGTMLSFKKRELKYIEE